MDDAVNLALRNSSDRIAGLVLMISALLSVLAMSHHPSGHAEGHLGMIVHGVMIVIVLAMLAGFVRLSQCLGLRHFSVVAGLVAYSVATIGQILAASINGFIVVGALRAGGHGGGHGIAPGSADGAIAHLLWTMNQTFAYGAAFLTGAAFVLFSLALWRNGGVFSRIVALSGIVCGLAPVVLLASGMLNMHVAGAFIVYGLLAAFTFIAGLWLMLQARQPK